MSMVRKFGAAAIAAMVAAGTPWGASAMSFDVTQQNASSVFKDASGGNAWFRNVTVTLDNANLGVSAGLFRLRATGADIPGGTDDFTAFCIDLGDWLKVPASYSAPYNPGFSSTQIESIDKLLTNAVVSNALSAAATQVALWEIVVDGTTGVNLEAGRFKLGSNDVRTAASGLLANISSGTWAAMSGGLRFIDTEESVLNGRTYGQELVTRDLSAVPLPASIWLFGGAFAGFAALRRKRAA